MKFNIFLNGVAMTNLQTFQVDAQGNLVFDANGLPILIKNSQIERPLDAPSKPSAPFGPKAGVTSILALVPSVPALDDPIPQEPPVTGSAPPPPLGSVPPTDTGSSKNSGAKTHGKTQPHRLSAPASLPERSAWRPPVAPSRSR